MWRAVVLCALVVQASAIAHAQTLGLGPATFEQSDDQLSWEYEVTIAGSGVFVLELVIPRSDDVVDVLVPRDPALITTMNHRAPGRWEITSTGNSSLQLTLKAPAARFKNTTAMRYAWNVAGQPASEGITQGPELKLDPSRVRLVFGAGATVRHDDIVDFKIDETTNTLFVDNDSRLRPSGILGALFTLKRFGESDRTVGALVSLEFTNNTGRSLDGFLFGLTYSVNAAFSVGGGVSMRLGQELGPGFRRAALDAVGAAPDDSPLKRFAPILGDDEGFDGFPLTTDIGDMQQPIFPRDQIIKQSTNTSFFFGVFIPVDVVSVFRNLGAQ